MAELLRLISPGPARPVPGAFIETETAADLLHTLETVFKHPGEEIGLIIGAPGVGKTKAAWHFKHAQPGVFMHEAVHGEGGVWNLANELCRILEIEAPNGRRLPEERRRIGEAIGAESMLIIDEAQYLVQRNTRGKDDWQAFEWLRAMAKEGMLSLVFCGDPTLRELETVSPSLWTKMRKRFVARAPKSDIEALAETWGIRDRKALDALFTVSRRAGALRAVASVCREAWALAGDRTPALDHILAAVEDLNLIGAR